MSAHLPTRRASSSRWPPPRYCLHRRSPEAVEPPERPVPRATGPSRAQPFRRGDGSAAALRGDCRVSVGRLEAGGMKVMAPKREPLKPCWASGSSSGSACGHGRSGSAPGLESWRMCGYGSPPKSSETWRPSSVPYGAMFELTRRVRSRLTCDSGTTHSAERRLVHSHPGYVPTTQTAHFGSLSTRSVRAAERSRVDGMPLASVGSPRGGG